MTRPYYAPITSGLLVRKGEARPWAASTEARMDAEYHAPPRAAAPVYVPPLPSRAPETPVPPPPAPQIVQPLKIEPPPLGVPHVDDHVRRCSIRLSQNEFERLGIIAVKKEISRQQLLRQAIEHYLAAARDEYRAACACVGGDCKGNC